MGMLYGLPYTLNKTHYDKDGYFDTVFKLRDIIQFDKPNPKEFTFFGKDYQDKGFVIAGTSTYCGMLADLYRY